MNSRFLLLPALAGLLVAGCQTKPPAQEVVLQLTSALPVSYSGVIEVDGKKEQVSGMTPATLTYKANTIHCNIAQGPEGGMLSIEVKAVSLPQRLEMVTGTTGPNTEARGSVSFN